MLQLGRESDKQMDCQKDGKNKSDCFTIKSIRAKLSRPKIPKIFRKSRGDSIGTDSESKESITVDKKNVSKVSSSGSDSASEIPIIIKREESSSRQEQSNLSESQSQSLVSSPNEEVQPEIVKLCDNLKLESERLQALLTDSHQKVSSQLIIPFHYFLLGRKIWMTSIKSFLRKLVRNQKVWLKTNQREF